MTSVSCPLKKQSMLKNLILVALIITTTFAFSQERDKDTITTDVISVVKPYTPKISDAFKVKETPTLDDEVTTTKKEIKYNIFSIPVASTFTPAKGKAAVVDKEPPMKLFDNYASIGVGTYTSILGEVYLNHALNRNESVGGYLNYHSSQGGIDGLLLDDKFADVKLNVNYSKKQREYSWNVDAGYQNQVFNWYGLPQPLFDATAADTLDVRHQFHGFHFGGELKFNDSYIKNGSIEFRRFADDQESGENRFVAKTNIDFPITDNVLNTTIRLDYLGGNFNRSYSDVAELKYGNFNIGLSPSYQIKQDDLTVNLGVSLFYLNDTENSDNKIFIYPNVTASYRLVDEILIAYGGVEGDLIQNSYYQFAQGNPFVSPTLNVMPTDQVYKGYVGLKGKLSNSMSYNFRGSYAADNDKALYRQNAVDTDQGQDYNYGNSFGIVYDDLKTIGLFGELNVDVNRNFKLGLKAEYFVYDSKTQAEPWNLPDFSGSLFLDYQIDRHWFMGVNLFYIGERKDQITLISPVVNVQPTTVILEAFFDANAHVGYRINDRFSVYAKAANIASQDYQRWLNFPVQSIQFLAGSTYKFDF